MKKKNADETNFDASMRVIIIDGMALANKVHKDKNMTTWKVILIDKCVTRNFLGQESSLGIRALP